MATPRADGQERTEALTSVQSLAHMTGTNHRTTWTGPRWPRSTFEHFLITWKLKGCAPRRGDHAGICSTITSTRFTSNFPNMDRAFQPH